ncbi:BA14K family protein [Chelativorans sp. Marseille-P2723]|uniref:BA14K family protein n=1 Tax=Chelativorans sp. Marseille-P2723 TaxID=2709133 RepID=UPI0015713EEA|nr:BA14K family protein [Chelativorans sp. Marseille-P2723]
MRHKSTTSLCVALALALGVGSAMPAMAGPLVVPSAPAEAPRIASDIIPVQSRRFEDRNWDRRDRFVRRDRDRDRRDRFERRGNIVYWRGHRGYRHRRPGYRYYDGWWFPPAAFALGAIIGGALNQQVPVAPPGTLSNAHIRWCYDRYRSYRASDNTFQPYNGPRRPCVSPYS